MNDRKMTMIGAALVAAGSIVTAVGANVSLNANGSVLTILGAGLVAAGLTLALRAPSLTRFQAVVVGAVLIACGTVMAVFGASADAAEIQVAITPIGGAIFIAGIIELVLGVSDESPRLVAD